MKKHIKISVLFVFLSFMFVRNTQAQEDKKQTQQIKQELVQEKNKMEAQLAKEIEQEYIRTQKETKEIDAYLLNEKKRVKAGRAKIKSKGNNNPAFQKDTRLAKPKK